MAPSQATLRTSKTNVPSSCRFAGIGNRFHSHPALATTAANTQQWTIADMIPQSRPASNVVTRGISIDRAN